MNGEFWHGLHGLLPAARGQHQVLFWFDAQAVKVLLTAFSLQAKQPDLLSVTTHSPMFDVGRSMFDVQALIFLVFAVQAVKVLLTVFSL
jgi:hypothetical protein